MPIKMGDSSSTRHYQKKTVKTSKSKEYQMFLKNKKKKDENEKQELVEYWKNYFRIRKSIT